MKITVSDERGTTENAAEHIRRLLYEKPDAALALTAGRSTRALYDRLAELCAEGELDFSCARIFAVTELIGAEKNFTCRAALERELIDKINIRRENVFYPREERPEDYDSIIRAQGGIDLAVLGIGLNGHIGYNEPTTQFETYTHIARLTKGTRQALGEEKKSIAEAVTMGIKTICSAGEIIMLAFGEEKAEIVFKAVYGRTDSLVPAAFLQIPQQVKLYIDTAAAGCL